ncbi:hypothetical protein ACIHFD_49685 [Nonomuraea sp. NPDC051941]|uniref:hypothetical protein n=1 Tax=Nonomuraea sp. NPDC051941 TaxID=3364373 RepID=UPI0037C529C0
MNILVRHLRLAVINHALAHIDNTPGDVVVAQLASPTVRMRGHLRNDPAALADFLRSVTMDADTPTFYAAFKGAQNVLIAAGLPYMPDPVSVPAARI